MERQGRIHKKTDLTSYVNAVSDTGSIDLTLTGQSISGVVLPGGVDHDSLLNVHQDVNTTESPIFVGLTITGNSVFGLNSAIFQPATDSTTFFQVLDFDGGTPILNVDTINKRVGIGTALPTEVFQVKDGHFSHYSTSGDYGLLLDSGTVAHGMTGIGGTYANINTNTYGYFAIASSSAGGMTFSSFRESTGTALAFNSHQQTTNPGTNPGMVFQAWKSDGSDGRDAIDDANVIADFRAGSTTKVRIYGDGQMTVGGKTTPTTVDPMLVVKRTRTGAGSAHAFVDETSLNKTADAGYNSFDSRPTITGSNNYDHMASFQARFLYNSSGTIGRLTGFQSLLEHTGGVCTRLQHFEARNYTGEGTVTDQYGLYVEALTSGTTNHGIHFLNAPNGGSVSTDTDIDFTILPGGTGKVGIGTPAPDNFLEVLKSQNGTTLVEVNNINAGASAAAGLGLTSDGGSSYIMRTSAAYGAGVADDLVLQEAGGGDIVFYQAAETLRVTNAGLVKIGGATISDSSGNLASANGANFGPGGVTSITVVNGIVTAIS